MWLLFGLGLMMLVPFFPSAVSFYVVLGGLGLFTTLGGVDISLWSGEIFSVSSWSWGLIGMSFVLSAVSVVCCPPSFKKISFNYSLQLVCLFSVLSFLVEGGFLFFLLFECTFFPISYLILLWGYNKERVLAVLYMSLYSFFGSIFHMVGLSLVGENMGLAYFSATSILEGEAGLSVACWFSAIFFLFLVKAPLYVFHLWLSKAHVEAPTSASMVLAAILLKLGVFGLIGYSSWSALPWLSVVLQVFGLMGSVYASVVCLRSQNMKLVIAQSSVGHMSLCVSAFFSGSSFCFHGACLMAVVHGFCSAGMFAWAGRHYSMGGSQSGILVSGQRLVYFDGALCMLFLLICNSGVPPFISFWMELFFFSSLYMNWVGMIYWVVSASLFCMLFNVVLGLGVFHGGLDPSQVKQYSYPLVEVSSIFLMTFVLLVGFFF